MKLTASMTSYLALLSCYSKHLIRTDDCSNIASHTMAKITKVASIAEIKMMKQKHHLLLQRAQLHLLPKS